MAASTPSGFESSDTVASLRGVGRRVNASDEWILREIDLDIERRSMTSLLGPSGSGKSTLLRLLNRLDEVDAGDIDMLGRPVMSWPVRELRRRVAMVFQEPSLLNRTVRENLHLPFELSKSPPPSDLEERMREALEVVQLEPGMLNRQPDELSVGQKQRVTLARALLTDPEVLLLDEPTSALDPRTARMMLDGVMSVARRRPLTVIMATHRIDEAKYLGGRVAVLIDGQLKGYGSFVAVTESLDRSDREFLELGSADDE